MKRVFIFLVLILMELILTSFSPWGKRTEIDPSNKDVFYRVSFLLKRKLSPIKFWVEGDAGYYSVSFTVKILEPKW
jgi:hypothetical protein